MARPSFEQFKTGALARGFDEVLERQWQPHTLLDTHSHAFSVDALLVQGEMWLTVGADSRHLLPGDSFQLDHDIPHAERYGAEGATYWVARRNAAC